MTISEMHNAFKVELDKTSSLQLPAFEPEEIDYWLNRAIRQFIKNKFIGTDKGVGFEQISKRIMDLSNLVQEDKLTFKSGTPVELDYGTSKENSYVANLSTCTYDPWFLVGEEVNIGYDSIIDDTTTLASSIVSGNTYYVVSGTPTHDGITFAAGDYFTAASNGAIVGGTVREVSAKTQGVTECTSNDYRFRVDDPYSEHRLHYEEAKPLRLVYKRYVELITDGNYGVTWYRVRYVKQPLGVSYVGSIDCELAEHTHDEVVVLAANMALENIEQNRFKSHQVELSTIE